MGYISKCGNVRIDQNPGSEKMLSYQVILKPSSIACFLGTTAFILVMASIAGDIMAYLIFHEARVEWFLKIVYVDSERNIPTFFSQLLLLAAALLLAVITWLKKTEKAPHVAQWGALSFGFLLMAADEAFFIHDKLIKPVGEMIGKGNLGFFYFAWVIPGIILVLMLIPLFLKFLLRLPPKTRLSFLIAFIIYIGGAIGFEMIGGRYAEFHGYKNLTYRIITTVEEGLEMTGVIIFIWALLVYIAGNYEEILFLFEKDS
jgi:hypothetical protein